MHNAKFTYQANIDNYGTDGLDEGSIINLGGQAFGKVVTETEAMGALTHDGKQVYRLGYVQTSNEY